MTPISRDFGSASDASFMPPMGLFSKDFQPKTIYEFRFVFI